MAEAEEREESVSVRQGLHLRREEGAEGTDEKGERGQEPDASGHKPGSA